MKNTSVCLLMVSWGCGGGDVSFTQHSGSRLKLAGWETTDGARQIRSAFDTELGVPCTFQRWSGDIYYCVPNDMAEVPPAAIVERFVRADCDWQVSDAVLVPTFLVADDGFVMQHQFHDIEREFDCAIDHSGTCVATEAGDRTRPWQFAKTITEDPGRRIQRMFWESNSGAQQAGLFDKTLDSACEMIRGADGVTRCVPIATQSPASIDLVSAHWVVED